MTHHPGQTSQDRRPEGWNNLAYEVSRLILIIYTYNPTPFARSAALAPQECRITPIVVNQYATHLQIQIQLPSAELDVHCQKGCCESRTTTPYTPRYTSKHTPDGGRVKRILMSIIRIAWSHYFTSIQTPSQVGHVPEGDKAALSPPGCLGSGDCLSGEHLPGEGEA